MYCRCVFFHVILSVPPSAHAHSFTVKTCAGSSDPISIGKDTQKVKKQKPHYHNRNVSRTLQAALARKQPNQQVSAPTPKPSPRRFLKV